MWIDDGELEAQGVEQSTLSNNDGFLEMRKVCSILQFCLEVKTSLVNFALAAEFLVSSQLAQSASAAEKNVGC